jgi:hypothetical protein
MEQMGQIWRQMFEDQTTRESNSINCLLDSVRKRDLPRSWIIYTGIYIYVRVFKYMYIHTHTYTGERRVGCCTNYVQLHHDMQAGVG